MKPRLIYRHGKWWCKRMGVTGCGQTPLDAYNDMWGLYRSFIASCANRQPGKVRFA